MSLPVNHIFYSIYNSRAPVLVHITLMCVCAGVSHITHTHSRTDWRALAFPTHTTHTHTHCSNRNKGIIAPASSWMQVTKYKYRIKIISMRGEVSDRLVTARSESWVTVPSCCCFRAARIPWGTLWALVMSYDAITGAVVDLSSGRHRWGGWRCAAGRGGRQPPPAGWAGQKKSVSYCWSVEVRGGDDSEYWVEECHARWKWWQGQCSRCSGQWGLSVMPSWCKYEPQSHPGKAM